METEGRPVFATFICDLVPGDVVGLFPPVEELDLSETQWQNLDALIAYRCIHRLRNQGAPDGPRQALVRFGEQKAVVYYQLGPTEEDLAGRRPAETDG